MLALALPTALSAAPLSPCRVPGLKHQVMCGQVDRALDPTRPDGVRIAIHFVVVPATAQGKRPDPIVFMAGGPGQSAIALAAPLQALTQRLGQRRDLVFIDQRGTGRSAPLACDDPNALRRPIAWQLDTQRAIDRLAACMKRLQTLPHGDLRQYTTTLAMADTEAVRAALGAETINLIGASYGTRAVLEYLRLYPQRVRRAVMDGVAPPDLRLPESQGQDVAAALEQLFADCDAEAACAQRHPRLREQWAALLRRAPVVAEVIDPASGRPARITVSPELIAAMVRGPLYSPALASALPLAIDDAVALRHQALLGLAAAAGQGSRAARIAEGMHFSVVCAEDAAVSTPAMGELGAASAEVRTLQAAYARPYQALCAAWPKGDVPPAFYRVSPSPVPVLALSGGLDPVTPPRHAQRVVDALGPKARHLVAPKQGHGVLSGVCARELLHRFIDADEESQALAVDGRCLTTVPRPPAFAPAAALPPSREGAAP